MCYNKHSLKYFSEIILSYTLATGSSGTDFALTDTVSIRYIEIRIFVWLQLKLIFITLKKRKKDDISDALFTSRIQMSQTV